MQGRSEFLRARKISTNTKNVCFEVLISNKSHQSKFQESVIKIKCMTSSAHLIFKKLYRDLQVTFFIWINYEVIYRSIKNYLP